MTAPKLPASKRGIDWTVGKRCFRLLVDRVPFGDTEPRVATTADLEAAGYVKATELSALRLEVAAWRALAEHGAFTDSTVSRPWAIANGRWRMSCSAIIAEAATPGEVAIDLARKLQLIPAEPDESREGRER